MIQIMEKLVRVSMTPSEAACFKRVFEFYKQANDNYRHDLGQGGTCANFVSVILNAMEGM